MIDGYKKQDFERSCANCKFRAWLYLNSKYSIHCTKNNVNKPVDKIGVCPNHEHNTCFTCRYIIYDGGYYWCDRCEDRSMVSTEDKACKKWRKKKELCK